MREAEIEAYLASRIKAEGGIALKFVSPGRVGVPDRIVLMPGGVIRFVELKSPGESLDEAQIRIRDLFNKLGTPVYVLDTKERVDWFIERKL